MSFIQRWRTHFSDFFHTQERPYGLAIIRIIVPLVLLNPMFPRWFVARELFSSDGAPAPLTDAFGYYGLLPTFPGPVCVALYTILIFSLITSSIGWMTRTSLILSTVLLTYFGMLDAISTITKYTVIAIHALFLLSLSDCGAVWSVDRWLEKRRGETRIRTSAVWPRRLMQFMIGAVYFGASVTKMHTPSFFSGDQLLYWMLTNVNNPNPVGEAMTGFPPLLVAFGYITVVWEVTFIFLAWRGFARTAMLILGAVFHVMTGFTLGLWVFPWICIPIYAAFYKDSEILQAQQWLAARLNGAQSIPNGLRDWIPSRWVVGATASAVAFSVLLSTITVAGVSVEHFRDVYGERRPGGRFQLKELDPEVVEEMLEESKTIHPKDMLLSFDIGTAQIANLVAFDKKIYQTGDQLFAQCRLSPPHPDLWVETDLVDAFGKTIDIVGQALPREQSRADFVFRLGCSLTSGRYSLILKIRGEEVARRTFQLEECPMPGAVQ